MKLISLSECNPQTIVEELKRGAVIVYPTETCYGLGCDTTNAAAVKKIYEIKHRTPEKSSIVLVDRLERISQYVNITPTIKKIAQKYWPGAVTVVVPAKEECTLPLGVVGKDGTIAFRVTSQKFAVEIVAALDRPIVSTSANIAGEANPYDVKTILRSLANNEIQPDIVIDAGPLPVRKPSTIIKLVENEIQILRQGETRITI